MPTSITGWDNSVSVGVLKIDRHNKELLDMINNVYVAVEMQPELEITQMMMELSDYYKFHIACEEIWMSHSSYDSLNCHSIDHIKIRKFITKTTINAKLYRCPTRSLIVKLYYLVISHIKKFDKDYANSMGKEKMHPVTTHRYP